MHSFLSLDSISSEVTFTFTRTLFALCFQFSSPSPHSPNPPRITISPEFWWVLFHSRQRSFPQYFLGCCAIFFSGYYVFWSQPTTTTRHSLMDINSRRHTHSALTLLFAHRHTQTPIFPLQCLVSFPISHCQLTASAAVHESSAAVAAATLTALSVPIYLSVCVCACVLVILVCSDYQHTHRQTNMFEHISPNVNISNRRCGRH